MNNEQLKKLIGELNTLSERKEWNAVIAKCNEVVPLLPNSDKRKADVLNLRGVANSRMGNYADAIVDYDKAIAVNPRHAKTYIDRGIAKLNTADYVGAVADFDITLDNNPQDAVVYNSRGIAKGYLKDYNSSIADFDRALDINSQYAEAYHNRGFANLELGKNENAIMDFDQSIKLQPRHAEGYLNRSNAKAKMGDHEGSIADLEQAIEINPQYAEAYNNRGNSKDNLSDYEGAIADYDQALKINPQYTEAYSNRGVTKRKMGNYEGAIADHDQALKISPNYKNAIHNRAIALALQASEKGREEIEAKFQAQLRAQQEQFDRERQEQLQKQQKQQEQFDRERQEQLQEQREQLRKQQEQFDRERQEQQQKQQELLDREKEEREAGSRIIYSKEYERTLKKCDRKSRKLSRWVWLLSGALALAAVAAYGYIACLGIEAWQAAQSPMAMRNFSALSLFPFILIGTLVLSPLAWAIRILNRDKHKYWVLREDAAANLNLLRIIETGHKKREDLWLQLFDHHDKRGSANLIADWNRADTSGGNSIVSLDSVVKPGGGN